MQHVRFGRTGLKVSRLCLGTMTFGYQCDEETSFAIMDAAADAGISFFDTADVYPLGAPRELSGRTEEVIGQWLGSRRDQFIVATKCFFPTGPNPWDAGNSRKNIMRALDASLRRLGTDYVDLYQLHSWDVDTSIDETLQALDDVVRAGKVRYVGCSNFLAYRRSVLDNHALPGAIISPDEVISEEEADRLEQRWLAASAGPRYWARTTSSACSRATTCCSVRTSGNCCHCVPRKALPSFPTTRSPGASSVASTSLASRPRAAGSPLDGRGRCIRSATGTTACSG